MSKLARLRHLNNKGIMKVRVRGFLFLTVSVLFLLCSAEAYAQNDVSNGGKVSVVVIDAGHGGKDPGCVYRNYYEKNITLALATKLGDLIKKTYPDVKVIYTRSTDKYVELAERGKIANRANADLFISIHVNSATNTSARGTSSHVMGMDKSGKKLEVAMRENDIIIYEEDYTTKYEGYNPGDPASYIMFSLMQYAYQDQSMRFAQMVQTHFRNDLPMPDRGTTQEPFLVLWRASMPSILVEVGFMSNQTDRSYITSTKGQNEIARSLFEAFKQYKNDVEGKAKVVSAGSNSTASSAEMVSGDDYKGVLYYVQLSFGADKKKANDPCFKSYRNKVVAKPVKGKGYRYLVGGVKTYDEALKLQREVRKEFPDAFAVAYDGDRQIDLKTARRREAQ